MKRIKSLTSSSSSSSNSSFDACGPDVVAGFSEAVVVVEGASGRLEARGEAFGEESGEDAEDLGGRAFVGEEEETAAEPEAET